MQSYTKHINGAFKQVSVVGKNSFIHVHLMVDFHHVMRILLHYVMNQFPAGDFWPYLIGIYRMYPCYLNQCKSLSDSVWSNFHFLTEFGVVNLVGLLLVLVIARASVFLEFKCDPY